MDLADRGVAHGIAERARPGLHRRYLVRLGAVAELTPAVVSPAPDGAVALARAGMVFAGRDLDHGTAERAGPSLHRHGLVHGGAVAELAVGVVSPAPEGAVALARAAMHR